MVILQFNLVVICHSVYSALKGLAPMCYINLVMLNLFFCFEIQTLFLKFEFCSNFVSAYGSISLPHVPHWPTLLWCHPPLHKICTSECVIVARVTDNTILY